MRVERPKISSDVQLLLPPDLSNAVAAAPTHANICQRSPAASRGDAACCCLLQQTKDSARCSAWLRSCCRPRQLHSTQRNQQGMYVDLIASLRACVGLDSSSAGGGCLTAMCSIEETRWLQMALQLRPMARDSLCRIYIMTRCRWQAGLKASAWRNHEIAAVRLGNAYCRLERSERRFKR